MWAAILINLGWRASLHDFALLGHPCLDFPWQRQQDAQPPRESSQVLAACRGDCDKISMLQVRSCVPRALKAWSASLDAPWELERGRRQLPAFLGRSRIASVPNQLHHGGLAGVCHALAFPGWR